METVCVDGTCFEMEMEVTPEDTSSSSGSETGEETAPPVEEPVDPKELRIKPEFYSSEEGVAILAFHAILDKDFDKLYELLYMESDGQFVKKEDLNTYFMINSLGKYLGSTKHTLTDAKVSGDGYEKTVELSISGDINPETGIMEPVKLELKTKLTLNNEWKIVLPDFIINDFTITAKISDSIKIDDISISSVSEENNSKTAKITEISGIKHKFTCGNHVVIASPLETNQINCLNNY